MGFVAQDDSFKAKIGDKEYTMSFPTYAQMKNLKTRLDAKEADAGDVYAEFMKELGLPKEVFDKMSTKNVMALVQYVMDFEKKS